MIYLFGEDIQQLSATALDKLRSRVGFLFQSNALYDSMTVRENLEFPLRRHRMRHNTEETNKMVLDALDDVGLKHTIDMMPAELSGGMRKRIAMARTLIMKPEIILYDEPTTGLDPATGKEIIQLMVKIREKYGTASLIISHDMNCVKLAADKVLVLYDGTCYATGHYDELKYHSDPAVRQFFE
jgi:phospholipid/cholesterol/gamma-HCH transport system ATP-binding protein